MQFCRDAAACQRVVLAVLLALLLTLGVLGAGSRPAAAAQLGNITLPPRLRVGATRLVLNGYGLRTYSFLAIHVYVAGLYLERPSHDAQAILTAPGIKVLQIHFVHDVGVNGIRRAWETGLRNNCVAPCKLSPPLLSRFLAALQPVTAGDIVTFTFAGNGVTVVSDGKVIGQIMNLPFARLMLAVFLGPHVAAPQLKRELLGLG